MHHAAIRNKLSVIDYLLNVQKVNLEIKNNDGELAIESCISKKLFDYFKKSILKSPTTGQSNLIDVGKSNLLEVGKSNLLAGDTYPESMNTGIMENMQSPK